MASVEFESFCKVFADTVAVAGLDLAIPEGSIYGLLGPNGSGKTTCIRALCGLLGPSSGTVRLLGADAHSERARLRPRLGYMPQQAALAIIVPSLLLSGLLIPFASLSAPLQVLARLVPLTYVEDVLVPVFRDGQPVTDRLGYLALLALYAAALVALASLTLRERE